ncbi:predicted protein [Histoplasma capsulatum H143]|uniref:Uncharacterized protein n=2 Tax=Ajellomyces capsulatus TaxID=5037 RepID=C6H9C4_AJECH|nr:predicted protein [Histoplasma capsulatum H143]
MEFFVDWALWLKMCFFLVLIYGTGVHIYNSLRLKKLTAAAAREEAAVRTPGMLEIGSDDIPFGSRAIERGIEIEGIWISHHNTPVGSPRWGLTPDPSRPASLGSKSTLTFPVTPLPSRGGSDYLAPRTPTLGCRKLASVSSPLPYPESHDSANVSSSGINGRRAKSDFFHRNEQESESESHISQNDNRYSGFEFGDLGGVEPSDQQQTGDTGSINYLTEESGSGFEAQGWDSTPIATASEIHLPLQGHSGDSVVIESIAGKGQLRSVSGPPFEQAHLSPIENHRIIEGQQHGDLHAA